jgi:hypothetical protein
LRPNNKQRRRRDGSYLCTVETAGVASVGHEHKGRVGLGAGVHDLVDVLVRAVDARAGARGVGVHRHAVAGERNDPDGEEDVS